MMVGDKAACHKAFVALSARVEALRLSQLGVGERAGGEAAAEWQALVPRFRALRESLTSEGVDGELPLSAYLLAAEACLRAGDVGEYLKCQQRLLTELFPDAAARGEPHARWSELAACAVLYFAVAVDEANEVAAALRTTPPALLRSAPLRCALRALGALSRRDGPAFCACAQSEDATLMMRLLMARRLPAARELALCAFARAYRQLPATSAVQRLGVDAGQLSALLKEASARPAAAKQLVAAAAAWSDEAADLVFAV